jgi:hypothetical protein
MPGLAPGICVSGKQPFSLGSTALITSSEGPQRGVRLTRRRIPLS